MTTTDDKKHLRRFFGKDDSTMAPEGRWPDPELSLPASLFIVRLNHELEYSKLYSSTLSFFLHGCNRNGNSDVSRRRRGRCLRRQRMKQRPYRPLVYVHSPTLRNSGKDLSCRRGRTRIHDCDRMVPGPRAYAGSHPVRLGHTSD
jgi:hypothetical protein